MMPDNFLDSNDIAIIGMSCCFPKSNNIYEYWENLVNGKECLSEYSDDALIKAGIKPEIFNDPRYVRISGSIDDIEYFDASFFDYSPGEASIIDPQQRLFLEEAWKALEDANCNTDNYRGLIGIYAGTGMNSYLYKNLMTHKNIIDENGGYHVMVASDKDFLATRASYKMNLKGPSITIQTACSSSMVAVHTACQALRSGECDIALAGGVSLQVPQKAGYLYHEGIVLSPDGHCRAFDEKARGTAVGNGAGVIVLKILSEALDDNDLIYAVIKGSAINNDGSLKAGYTAPGLESQASVIYEAMSLSNVKPETVSYVETHGTGTQIGDPIEIAALTRAYKTGNVRNSSCPIGSVKTNIGHLDAAAGIAGIIKTALALKNCKIPASLNFNSPNPKIDFNNSPFYVNTKLTPWISNGNPRRAGVSSFGIGGTNAHTVLQEAPGINQATGKSFPKYYIMNFSAKTEGSLNQKITDFINVLENEKNPNLDAAAFTLSTCRKSMKNKLSFVCNSKDEALEILKKPAEYKTFKDINDKAAGEIAFVFPGQGSQYINMGLDLYENEFVFRESMNKCFGIVNRLLGIDMKKIIYPDPQETGKADSRTNLNRTLYSQPALFIIEYCLAKLLIFWGIQPKAMIGHSIGEYAAACISGVFSLEEGLEIVVERGKLIDSLQEGSMLSIALSEQELLPLLENDVSIAAVNGAALCVASGSKESISALEKKLSEVKVPVKLLHASHAFHSAMMDPILPGMLDKFSKISLNPPKIPYISSCTGQWIKDEEATDPAYWIKHLRQSVRFYEGAGKLLEIQDMVLIEAGPGKVLNSLLRHHPLYNMKSMILNMLPHPEEKADSLKVVYEALSRLWVSGIITDWKTFYGSNNFGRQKIRLPVYPFDRKPYWIRPLEGFKTKINDGPYLSRIFVRKNPENLLLKTRPAENRLVFMNNDSFSEKLAEGIISSGDNVITIRADKKYLKENENSFLLPLSGQEDYPRLFGELEKQQKHIGSIIYLWALADPGIENQHFKNILTILRYAGMSRIKQKIRVTGIFQKLADISGIEEINPDIQSIPGLISIVNKEYDNINFQVIDIGPGKQNSDLAGRSVQDVLNSAEPYIAYRNRIRWVLDYEDTGSVSNTLVSNEKTYLYLSAGSKNLTDELRNDKSLNWIIAGNVPADSQVSGLIPADLSNREDVLNIEKNIKNSGITVSGIFYNPVIEDIDGTISGTKNPIKEYDEKSFDKNTDTIRKEIDNITGILSGLNPGFIAVLGDEKLGIEKCWLEGYIRSLPNGNKIRIIIIDRLQDTGITDVGLIKSLPDGDVTDYIAVSNKNPLKKGPDVKDDLSESNYISRQSFDTRPSLANEYIPAKTETEEKIVKIWENILGVKPVGLSDNFFELGGSSLMIAQIISNVRNELDTELPLANVIYENPTVRHFADYIEALKSSESFESETPAGTSFIEGEL